MASPAAIIFIMALTTFVRKPETHSIVITALFVGQIGRKQKTHTSAQECSYQGERAHNLCGRYFRLSSEKESTGTPHTRWRICYLFGMRREEEGSGVWFRYISKVKLFIAHMRPYPLECSVVSRPVLSLYYLFNVDPALEVRAGKPALHAPAKTERRRRGGDD
jgi:hypothetical protein